MSRRCVREPSWDRQVPRAPSASRRCYRHEEGLTCLLEERYPFVLAHTGSCARPLPSSRLWLRLMRQIFAGCCQPLLRKGPSRRYLCRSLPTCLDPYSGCPQGAHSRFFPQGIGLPRVLTGSALHHPQQLLLSGFTFRSCSHSLMFRPASLLATPVAPTLTSHDVGQPWLLHPRLSRFVASPCSGHANRPNREIGGKRTFTPQNRQPCRLLLERSKSITSPYS